MNELQAEEPTPDAPDLAPAAALAALGYSTLLLICWLFSAELLQKLQARRKA